MALTVNITQDGSQVSCLIGPDLMTGIAGFGDTVADAMHALAYDLEEYTSIESIEAALERASHTGTPPRSQP